MNGGWESIVPPIAIFVFACVTKNVVLSFSIGIILAACIATQWSLLHAGSLLVTRISAYFQDTDSLFLHLFLLGIGTLITFFSLIRNRYTKKNRNIPQFSTARRVEYAAFFVAPLFFIDDYLGILTLGFLMRQLAETVRVSRERLAFIVQSLGAPLVILVPISSWAAAIIAQFDQAGVQGENSPTATIVCDPLFLYVQSIPYIFYSIFLLFSLWLFIDRQIILEKKQEQDFLPQEEKVPVQQFSSQQLFDIFSTIVLLVLSVLVGLLVSGGFPTKSMFDALRTNNSSFLVLSASMWGVLCFNVIKGLWSQRIFFSEFFSLFYGGLRLMYQSMLIIALSSIFGFFVRYDLKTGYFLAASLLENVSVYFLACITFFTSLVVTLFTGSAWGTFALMIPLIVPIVLSASSLSAPVLCGQLPLLPSVLGALFSGGVCGNHLSPFAETTNMAAAALQLTPMRHAITQFIYAIPAICATVVAYTVVGLPYFANYTVLKTIILGMMVSVITTFVVKWVIARN